MLSDNKIDQSVARRVARQRFLSLKRDSHLTEEARANRNTREKLKRRRKLLAVELRRAADSLRDASLSAQAAQVGFRISFKPVVFHFSNFVLFLLLDVLLATRSSRL